MTGSGQAVPNVWAVKVTPVSCTSLAELAPVLLTRMVQVFEGRDPLRPTIALSSVVEPMFPRSRVWPATALKAKVAKP